MKIHETGDEYTDWGDRAVYWLFSQRFLNWPLPAVAREIDEPLETVKSWANQESRPNRQALQRLSEKRGHEGFDEIVFGRRNPRTLEAKIDRLSALIIEIGPYLRAAPRGVVPRHDGERADLDGVQTTRKVTR